LEAQAQVIAPLDGLRVLDLSRVLAGPWCTQLLGDLGADVIKIERPKVGDDTRHWGPPWHGEGAARVAAYFLSANRGKRSAAIDFAMPEGAALVRQLAQQCDVMVENYRVGGLARFGLDAASLRAANPRLIVASITGFGQDGPYADRAGYDYIIQGMGGLMSVTGLPDGEPGGSRPVHRHVRVRRDPCRAVPAREKRRGRAYRHGAVRHAAGDARQPGVERAHFGRGAAAAG
jgi:crotonobetainyl-CoA:carnitine CoA-transferase CaiB-like acyl-CoA transferase